MTAGRLHGGGVSSSAAVGVAFLLAFEDVNGLSVSPVENIALDRAIENGYLGLRNGILDQAAVLLSRRGHLTRIDCRTSQHKLIPAAPEMPPFQILLAFSGLRRALVGTDYNRRVDECAEAAREGLARRRRPGRERARAGERRRPTSTPRSAACSGTPPPAAPRIISRRWRGSEKGSRPGEAATSTRFGALMTASGESSIRNYECGSPPLIDLYQTLVSAEGVLGARFSGAGFRGCCVALVRPEAAESVAAFVNASYARTTPTWPHTPRSCSASRPTARRS